jgi:hypothetical protein
LKPYEELQRIILFSDLDKNEWIDLIVAEVIALDKFFIQLVGEDTTDKLNTLMEDLK